MPSYCLKNQKGAYHESKIQTKKNTICHTGTVNGVKPYSAIQYTGRDCQRKYDGTEDGFAINFQITSRWDGAFTANVTIQNTGSKPIQNWALQFSMACNITNIWNGAVYQH
ncbi:cellulose binding domain-containing protein [[Clostridium] polysaccharolyticum]|uniref:cellulose binding domain-containing protein n=1 Tax=[Clostridium] polysaccharolyticum TaxID=29364 RepID=UPI000B841D00|nr:cellulose binding domain-containing protein [[Clostridium] polysaccharolyticum]